MKQRSNPEIQHINLENLDISELERRIELATQVAGCSCQATCSVDCSTLHVGTATTGC